MAKGKKNMPATAEASPVQVPFRADDRNIVLALDAFAKRTHRSRNSAIVALLEEALKEHGLWPWPPPEQD